MNIPTDYVKLSTAIVSGLTPNPFLKPLVLETLRDELTKLLQEKLTTLELSSTLLPEERKKIDAVLEVAYLVYLLTPDGVPFEPVFMAAIEGLSK